MMTDIFLSCLICQQTSQGKAKQNQKWPALQEYTILRWDRFVDRPFAGELHTCLHHAHSRPHGISSLLPLPLSIESMANCISDIVPMFIWSFSGGHPWVGEELIGCPSCLHIDNKHFLDEILAFFRNAGPIFGIETECSAADQLEQHALIRMVKRGASTDQNVDSHAQTPNVTGHTVLTRRRDDFRRSILRGSTWLPHTFEKVAVGGWVGGWIGSELKWWVAG